MTPRPPNWIRKSSTPWPKGLSTELMSTGVSPVTQTAEVARKQASRVCSSRPGCQLGGRQSSTVPRAMAPRKEKTGQVRGLNKRLHCIAVVCSRRGGIARRDAHAEAGPALRARRLTHAGPWGESVQEAPQRPEPVYFLAPRAAALPDAAPGAKVIELSSLILIQFHNGCAPFGIPCR